MTATLQQWQSVFDTWADADPNVASTGVPQSDLELDALARVLADWLQLRGDEVALDVGCANGVLTTRWCRRARHVVGVDYNQRLVERAQQLAGDSPVSFQRADAAALPFPHDRFDAVCCYGVFCCLPDLAFARRAALEAVRVARPGARVLLGGLPDTRRRLRFHELCEAGGRWYSRVLPRSLRWGVKRLLRPGWSPDASGLLWFDVEDFAAELRAEGLIVEIHDDPPYADYDRYRRTLLVTKPSTERVDG